MFPITSGHHQRKPASPPLLVETAAHADLSCTVRVCALVCVRALSPSQVSESGLKTNPLGQEQV